MNINIGQSAKVVLPVKSVAIKRTVRVGNNLEVYLSNGSVITLENYFPNKPTLLTNEGNNKVAEFTISDDGIIVGIKELSADEAASMLSNAYSSLSTQPNDVLLLSANDASANTANTAVSGKSYTMEVIGASAGLLAGMFILSDKGSKSTPAKANKTDDSKTTTERVDSDNNGTLDTEVITNRDASGQITKEIRKTDANNNGKTEKIVTTQKNNDGSKTVTVEESTKDNGVFDKSVETTTDKNGNKKTVESRDTNNDGKKDNIITTETNTDGSKITTEKKTDGSTITTKDDGKGNTSIETKNLDGTSSKQETKSDGTKIHTEKNSEGIITSTTTKPSGETYTTTTKPDGKGGSTSVTVNKDKSGNTTSTENAIDKNNDGNSEETIKTETKPDGTKVITKTEDLNSDGKTDSTTRTETKPSGETQSVTENADGTTVTTTVSKPNPDGSTNSTIITKNKNGDVVATTNKVTQDDGSSVANTTRPDGSTSITKDNGKGTVTIENRDPSGKLTDSTTTVTKANGSSVSTTEKADGTSVTTTTKPNKDGSTSATAVEKDANNNIIATTETKTKPNGDSTSETKYSNGTSTNVTKTDTNGDGTQDTTVITEKDKNGKVISTETSVDLSPTDGNPETVTKVEPQADGSTKTTVTKDNNSDGKVDSVAESKAQSNGTTTKKVEHKDENGNVTGTSETTTTPDGKGGSVSHTVHKDVNGKVTGKTESTTKPDGKGGETTTTIEKNKDDQVISKTETQKNADGSSTSETKNTDGTSSTTQDNGKGVVTTTEKDKDNKVTSTETVIDANKDGNPESVVKTETKTDGTKVTTEKADKDSNGQADSETMTTTRPDDTSTVEKKEDTNGDGTLDTKTTIEKTKDGKTTSTKTVVDKDADGNPESTKVEEKKSDTTIITETVDKDSDGTVDSTITTTKRPDDSSTIVVKNQDGSTSTTEDSGKGIVIKTEKDKEGNVTKSTEVTREDGSKTTTIDTSEGSTVVEQKDTDGNNTLDTTITTEKDKNGNTVSTTTVVDKDQDGKAEVTKVETKNQDGTTTIVKKEDNNDDGKVDVTTTTTKHTDGSSTSHTQNAADGSASITATNGKDTTATVGESGATVSGTTIPGATVTVTDKQGNELGKTVANNKGEYNVTLDQPKTNGETVNVNVKDPAAGTTTTTPITVLDTTPPVAPSAENTQAAGNKDNGTVTVTGTTEPEATVVIKDANGEKIGEGKANKEGNYSVELTKPDNAKNGETLNVEVTDKAGQTTKGTITAADITPPEAPNAEEIKKVVSEDKNKVTISGKTEPGATVVIKDANGEEIGKAKADEKSGEYSVDLTKPDNAKNGETLTVEVTDKSNNTVKANITAPDVTPPVAPSAENTQAAGNKDNGTVTVTGTTEPEATVVIKDANGEKIGEGKANKEGNYSVELTKPDNAKNGETLTVEVTDKSNNTVKTNITAPDVTPPEAPSAENTQAAGNKDNGTVTVTGTTEPEATVVIKDANGEKIGEGKANKEGNYSVELTKPDNAKNGETLNVEVTDKAGQTTKGTITAADITPPEAPNAEEIKKVVSEDKNKVTISGKTEPGATVIIKDANGEEIGKAKADEKSGEYSVDLTKPDNAKNGETLTVEATDKSNNTVKANITAPDVTPPVAPSAENTQAAGNKDNGTVTVTGTTEPEATVVIKDANGEKIGEGKANKEGNYSVELTKPDNAKNGETLNVEVTDKAGQTTKGTITAADITPPEAPNAEEIKKVVSEDKNKVTISGKTEPGATVVIKDANGEEIGKAKADEKSGEYSVDLTKPDNAKNGETLTVEVTDKSNNTVKANITAPDVTPPVAPNAEEIKKVVSEDKNKVTISGKTEPGATVVIKDANGEEIGKAKADEKSGEYSIDLTKPENAKNGETLTVEVTDKSNNTVKTNITAPDVTPPVAPSAENTNTVANENDSITVKGKTEPGATVVIKDKNDKEIGGATANEEGNYDITLNDATNAKNGETLTIEVTDKAKQKTIGTITAPDVTPAKVPDAEEVKVTGNKDNGGKVTISGKTEPGAAVVIRDAKGEEIGRGKADDESGQYSVELTKADNAKNGEKLTLEITDKSNKPVTAEITAPDITPPKQPTNLVVNEVGNMLTGENGEPGSTIEVKAQGSDQVLAQGVVKENGTFSIEVPTTAPENVLVIAKDKKGNTTDAQSVRLPDLSDPLTAVVQNDTKVSTYTDINHDGIADTAEVATYKTVPILNERTKEVENDAKVLQIDHYLEGSDIAGGKGDMNVANGGRDLDLKNPDQRTYFIYDDEGNLKKRLYDLDAKNAETGSKVNEKIGIDRYEEIEASETKTISVKGNNGVVENKKVVLETQIAYNNDADTKNKIDAREYRTYDDQGRKTQVFYDDNADGTIDRAEKYTYSDDIYNPNPIMIEYDNDANGVTKKGEDTKPTFELDDKNFDKVEYFEHKKTTTEVKGVEVTEYLTTAKYVNTDNKTETGSKQTINGQEVQGLDIIEKYDYNDYNRQTKIEYDNNGDGTADKIHYQQFDSLGRVNKVLVDNDAKTATGKLQQHDKGLAEGIDQVLKYGYNLKSVQTLLERDNNVDGTYDYREAYTLDPNGKVTQKEIDLTNDGQFDKKEIYSLNSTGGVERTTHSNILVDPDSGIAKEFITSIIHDKLDANNNIERSEVDLLGDTSINSKKVHKLNAYGQPSETLFDIDGKGSTDRREIYEYYPDRTLKKKQIDIGNNYSIDSSETFIRDALGRTTTQLLDNENNGSPDSAVHYTYDDYGRVIRMRRDSDNNLDTPDYVETITYDALGNRERAHIDRTGNGVTSDDVLYYFTSTNYGQLYTVTEYDPSRVGSYINSPLEIDNPNKAALRYIRTNHYDDFGRAIIWEVDRDGDGKLDKAIDQIRYFSYDYDGNNLNSQAFDRTTSWKVINGLGKTDRIEYFEHDSLGSTKLTMIDFGGDGRIEQLIIGNAGGQADKAFHLDMTDSRDWTAKKLAKLTNLRFIQLSDESTESVLTLDQNALKALSKEVRILGDAKDTIHLEGIALRNLNSPTTIDKQIYNQYSTDIDGSTYKLIIDADINIL